MFDQWLDVLGSEDINLTATEIADICWLAMIQQRFGVEQPQSSTVPKRTTVPNELIPSPLTNPPAAELPVIPQRESPQSVPQPTGGLFPRKANAGLQADTKSLRVPTPPSIRDPLVLARALRPLMKQCLMGQGSQLDEEATVQKIAEERVWYPVSRPATEKWLELAIVVDESPSMLIWRRTVNELTRLFKHYGIFRDVRLWGLMAQEVDSDAPTSNDDEDRTDTFNPEEKSSSTSADTSKIFIRRNPFSRFQMTDLRQPESLLDPTGRRLILIISDCVGEIWQQPSLLATLKVWSERSPLALLQMMPEWLWPRTNLRQTTLVNFQGKTEGSVNRALEVVLASTSYFRKTKAEKQADIKVPLITLECDRVHVWAQMLTAQGGHQAPGVIFNPRAQAMSVVAQQRRQQKETASQPSFGKAQTFRGEASPIARRLASLLAASPMVTQPVIRMVQETLLPQSEQFHVAEVLLGGILKPERPPALESNPDDVLYQFIEEDIRSDLLAEAPVTDTTSVLSTYIQDNFNKSLEDFILELRRLMRSNATNYDELKPIATIAAEVLQYRGREYAEFVREVKDVFGPLTPTNDENKPPTHTFPDLESFEFIEAHFTDETESPAFPPALSTGTFNVLTLESQLTEPFEIIVSKVAYYRRPMQWRRQWQVKRQKKTAQHFIERLPNNHSLDMVAVPSGTFLMGAPTDEPERSTTESPQHKVALQAFFMGRYPITQAQWRIVATLPQVQRELKPDPAQFKGDNRPVEQISWYDAVEFCARLSAYTGREYRLPAEAEWEYACRAGTTTPFHFGDMITTDVANYTGSAYADGPTGKSRNKTTPIDRFETANDWGLSDVHGNVFEWCQDHWHSNYDGAPTDGSAWLTEDEKAPHIIRGGSWASFPRLCRSAFRIYNYPDVRNYNIGFRVVCSAPSTLQ